MPVFPNSEERKGLRIQESADRRPGHADHGRTARADQRKANPIRHTGSVIYQVATGHGWSEIGDQRFEWEEKDIFCIPSWTPYRHGAASEAVLFSFNDFPAMKALGLYREEASVG